MEIPREKLLEMFKKMLLIRYFEQRAYEIFGTGAIAGTLHTYLGQEAVAVGIIANLTDNDFITSTHRGHGHVLAKGASPDQMMAELFGKSTGYCKAKGGSMHIADFKYGILGANGVVGGGIPIATGAGLSCKLKYKNQRVTACFFGDGASNTGGFHEAINLAGVWKLPVLFVCENNLYAMGTSIRKATAVDDIAKRAIGYGIAGAVADGNDVVDVYLKGKEAVARAKAGEGPTLIECKTYRMKGHSKYDPAAYRPPEEVEAWLKRDPIQLHRTRLLNSNVSEQTLSTIEKEMMEIIDHAVEFAQESPKGPVETCLEDVYCGE
ncbi:MAG: thiamine pyrophosphate-dependent dehydrogenase E1 component subunit alpha [Candidatus Helarchaeota archaeon]